MLFTLFSILQQIFILPRVLPIGQSRYIPLFSYQSLPTCRRLFYAHIPPPPRHHTLSHRCRLPTPLKPTTRTPQRFQRNKSVCPVCPVGHVRVWFQGVGSFGISLPRPKYEPNFPWTSTTSTTTPTSPATPAPAPTPTPALPRCPSVFACPCVASSSTPAVFAFAPTTPATPVPSVPTSTSTTVSLPTPTPTTLPWTPTTSHRIPTNPTLRCEAQPQPRCYVAWCGRWSWRWKSW
ncbi:hypothetical protein BJ165DRAFT_1464105 [Panaeolus papilionaceus]|nr:hypothetical protein BJ165DRAFT_1464105 [Panaeolus papilionaceus]